MPDPNQDDAIREIEDRLDEERQARMRVEHALHELQQTIQSQPQRQHPTIEPPAPGTIGYGNTIGEPT